MDASTGLAQGQLPSLVERIERLEEEKATIAADIKEVFAEAKANFEIAVKVNPQSGFAQYQLGMTSLNLGQMPDAVKALEAYLVAEPNGDKAAEVKATAEATAIIPAAGFSR